MNFRRRRGPETPTFQIAPMIDIIFNLLAFFIAAQIFSQWETEVDLKLPTAQTGIAPRRLPGEVIINVMKDGRVIVNTRTLDEAELRAMLARLVENFNNQPVLIRADKETAYRHVIRIVDLCRQTDLYNIAFATSVEEEK